MKFGTTADPGKDVDVNKCVLGCAALFPTESYFAGVRWDGKSKFLFTVSAVTHSTYKRNIASPYR